MLFHYEMLARSAVCEILFEGFVQAVVVAP